jgi:LPXTG-motif cell wall-anchored protein
MVDVAKLQENDTFAFQAMLSNAPCTAAVCSAYRGTNTLVDAYIRKLNCNMNITTCTNAINMYGSQIGGGVLTSNNCGGAGTSDTSGESGKAAGTSDTSGKAAGTIGVIFGSIVGVALLVGLWVWYSRRKKRRRVYI